MPGSMAGHCVIISGANHREARHASPVDTVVEAQLDGVFVVLERGSQQGEGAATKVTSPKL